MWTADAEHLHGWEGSFHRQEGGSCHTGSGALIAAGVTSMAAWEQVPPGHACILSHQDESDVPPSD